MSAEIPSWLMGDPARAVERLQEQRQRRYARSKQGRSEAAKRGLERLFMRGEEMGRKIDIAPHVTTALYQWGEWANRKQFWANLNITPFCKLLGIGRGRELPEIRLDPQSMAIHRAFHRIKCKATQMVLAGYYVGGVNWDDAQHLYQNYDISREYFNTLLKRGSLSLYNSAKSEAKNGDMAHLESAR